MKIKWNGHASFTITTDSGVKIITDPYEPGGFGGQIKYAPIPDTADLVLVSHDHADHNYVQGLKGSPVVVRDSQEVKGIKFTAIPAYHDPNKGAERGRNTIFVFEADGVKVAFLGDLGHIPEPEQAEKLKGVDVLLIPVGGTFTIDARQASEVVEMLKPKIAIPMHYKTEKLGFPIRPVDDFLSLCQNVKKLESAEVELKKEQLPSPTEIWVLNYAC